MTERYASIATSYAARMKYRLPKSVTVEDLASAGAFGLMNAIERFDPERGVKFETFAGPHVNGAMLDWLREIDWVPRLVRTRKEAVVTIESLNKKRYETGAGSAVENVHLIPDPRPAADEERAAEIEKFDRMLIGLNTADRLLMRLYYVEELQMHEIGRALGLSESRVSQLHSALLARLKARLTPVEMRNAI